MPESRLNRFFPVLDGGIAPGGWRLVLGLLLLVFPFCSYGHAFVQPYALPVPFAMYSTAAGVALVLSFVVMAFFPVRVRSAGSDAAVTTAAVSKPEVSAVGIGQLVSTGLLVLCILSGFIGTRDSFRNINMTMFWIVLVLLVPYLVALFGDFYRGMNPWRGLIRLLEFFLQRRFEGLLAYPRKLGLFPAFVLYIAFICVELFGQFRPLGLSVSLAVYTVIMIAGAILFGRDAWLAHAEFFGVQFSLLGRIAPFKRLFGKAVDDEPPGGGLSLVLVVLFMLASTAFDGLHATKTWVLVYWTYIYGAFAGAGPSADKFALAAVFYQVWQWVMLIASPFVYVAVFAFFVWLSKKFGSAGGGRRYGTSALMGAFVLPLLPIALVYHVSHYYTMLLWQLPVLAKLVSDPLGLGWNLLGTAQWDVRPWVVDVGTIWHTQVFLIVAGHIWSVVLSHLEALRQFGTPRAATLSQIPMLVLMVGLTTFGLWILSLPLA